MHFTADWGMFWIAVATFVFTGCGAFIGVVIRIAKHDDQWEKKFKEMLDATLGSDIYNGTSPATPWKTTASVLKNWTLNNATIR